MESKKMKFFVALAVMLMAISNVAAQEAPAPAPTSDASVFVPTVVASLIALSFEPDDELVDTPLVSPFLDSDDDPDDGEVLNELEEYGNAGKLCRKKVINNIDGNDLTFSCMIGFKNFVA
nr:arabinogalactan peptide 13 [Tanacetum cinerariifolium]